MKGGDFPPLFIDLFTKTMGMDEQEFELFCSHFREMTLRKKDYYLKEGSITNAKAYVKKGCSRTFVIDENGTHSSPWFVSPRTKARAIVIRFYSKMVTLSMRSNCEAFHFP